MGLSPESSPLGLWALVGSLFVTFSTVVALVVWMAKSAFKRQDRTMTYMENQLTAQGEIHGRYASATEKLADAVTANTNELKAMGRKFRCSAPGPRSRKE